LPARLYDLGLSGDALYARRWPVFNFLSARTMNRFSVVVMRVNNPNRAPFNIQN
jgi:hypothetical protein